MRIISRLDIKNNHVIKGINLEGLRKIGDPKKIIEEYYCSGIDEIIIIDSVASLYGRNNLFELIKNITKEIFVPITLGGGIRSIEDIDKALNSGADKVAINSGAIENPLLIKNASAKFGSSTIVSYIEAKKVGNNVWEPYKNCGRERSHLNLIDWIKTVQNNGCGEILLTSIDREGTELGFDIDLIDSIKDYIKKPLIISGGCGSIQDILQIKENYVDDSVAIASVLHYKKISISDIKDKIKS
jgi:imidazole glycerol-phosphate synthase subunit HisF